MLHCEKLNKLDCLTDSLLNAYVRAGNSSRFRIQIALLLLCSAFGEVKAQVTVGYYADNQTNTISFEAAGNTLTLSNVCASIGEAWTNGFGGVYQCEVSFGADGIPMGYGVSKAIFLNSVGYNIGIGSGWGTVVPVSGIAFFTWDEYSGGYQMPLQFAGIANGVPNEQLVGFGLTILSETGVEFGLITMEAEFSDGTTNLVSRAIDESGGSGNTFFGIKAPPGTSITNLIFQFNTNVTTIIPFDDVVFFTAVPQAPEAVKLKSITLSNQKATIEFPTFAGQKYGIEFSPHLRPGGWVDLPGSSTFGDGTDALVTDTNTAMPSKFYRLKLLP